MMIPIGLDVGPRPGSFWVFSEKGRKRREGEIGQRITKPSEKPILPTVTLFPNPPFLSAFFAKIGRITKESLSFQTLNCMRLSSVYENHHPFELYVKAPLSPSASEAACTAGKWLLTRIAYPRYHLHTSTPLFSSPRTLSKRCKCKCSFPLF